jgi:hypothetical protein
MFNPQDLENFNAYCDSILEQISREELLRKARHVKPGIRTQLFTYAGDLMIRTGTFLKTQAGHQQTAQSPSIFLRT